MIIVAGTGHRPNKLKEGFGSRAILLEVARESLQLTAASHVISGMALGWDQALAFAALELGIPLIAAVPFKGQERKWPAQAQSDYRKMLERAERVEIMCERPSLEAMQIRNEWMVDCADEMLALWNGVKEGGTWNCLHYAMRKRKPIQHEWESYQAKLKAVETIATADDEIPF